MHNANYRTHMYVHTPVVKALCEEHNADRVKFKKTKQMIKYSQATVH